MECYNITNMRHNPMEKRPEGLMPTSKTCEEWCGKLQPQCKDRFLGRSFLYEKKQREIRDDISLVISKHTQGLIPSDQKSIVSYIKGLVIGILK